jgi:hypothetical protein
MRSRAESSSEIHRSENTFQAKQFETLIVIPFKNDGIRLKASTLAVAGRVEKHEVIDNARYKDP